MENAEQTKLEETLTCPVCHDIFNNPHQLPCGHSMCLVCLDNMMHHSLDIALRCPHCRDSFGPVVVSQKCYALANIAEDIRAIRRRRDEQTKSVYCDCCPEKQTLAVKTCLKCEVSLCRKHIKDHLDLPVFTGHPLVRPAGDLLQRKCPKHGHEVPRFYCSTSRRCICSLCDLETKQQNLVGETSSVLRRQITEEMDKRFNVLNESIKKLPEDVQRKAARGNESSSSVSLVTVVLLIQWFILVYYAYSCTAENMVLRAALDELNAPQEIHHCRDDPVKSCAPPETHDQENAPNCDSNTKLSVHLSSAELLQRRL